MFLQNEAKKVALEKVNLGIILSQKQLKSFICTNPVLIKLQERFRLFLIKFSHLDKNGRYNIGDIRGDGPTKLLMYQSSMDR